MKIIFVNVLFLLLISSFSLYAQTSVTLKNGMILKGEILSETDSTLIIKTAFGEQKISRALILNMNRPEDKVVELKLRDGSLLKGNIIKKDNDKIILKTAFSEITIQNSDIVSSNTSEPRNIIIQLKDGSIVKGTIIEDTETTIVLKTNFGDIKINKSDISESKNWESKTYSEMSDKEALEIIEKNPGDFFNGKYKMAHRENEWVKNEFEGV